MPAIDITNDDSLTVLAALSAALTRRDHQQAEALEVILRKMIAALTNADAIERGGSFDIEPLHWHDIPSSDVEPSRVLPIIRTIISHDLALRRSRHSGNDGS